MIICLISVFVSVVASFGVCYMTQIIARNAKQDVDQVTKDLDAATLDIWMAIERQHNSLKDAIIQHKQETYLQEYNRLKSDIRAMK